MILVNGGAEEKKESPKTDTHTVVSGDTLSEIVYNYNKENGTKLTVNEVAKNSGISDPDKIYPGQEIKLGASNSTNSGSSLQSNNQACGQTNGDSRNISNSQSNTNISLKATEKSERTCAGSSERCKINYGAGDMYVTDWIASEKKKDADGKIEGHKFEGTRPINQTFQNNKIVYIMSEGVGLGITKFETACNQNDDGSLTVCTYGLYSGKNNKVSVKNYEFSGYVSMIVDGKTVEKKYIELPTENQIWDARFDYIGDVKFDYPIMDASKVQIQSDMNLTVNNFNNVLKFTNEVKLR